MVEVVAVVAIGFALGRYSMDLSAVAKTGTVRAVELFMICGLNLDGCFAAAAFDAAAFDAAVLLVVVTLIFVVIPA